MCDITNGTNRGKHCLDVNCNGGVRLIVKPTEESKMEYSEVKESGQFSDGQVNWVDNKDTFTFNNEKDKKEGEIREFSSGATRDQDTNKIDFEGFLSPIVLERFGLYMLKHQTQSNGSLRSSDNWKKGIPKDAYIKSAFRHFHDWWMEHDGYNSREGVEDALMGLLFNVMGYTHEILKEKYGRIDK